DQILLQYRSAVESWQEDPQDMSRVSRMSMLAREQKAKQAELETVVQSAVDRGATQTKERLIDLMIASRDLELYTRRLARHLGFVRGVQPNVDGSNQSLIDRLSSERRRSVQEFDRLNIELSEFAENELRRDAAVLPREQ